MSLKKEQVPRDEDFYTIKKKEKIRNAERKKWTDVS